MAPRIPVDPAHIDEYGVADATGMVPGFTAARQRMLDALARLDRVDPVTHELCRLLNANLQQCNVCMRYRYTDADEQLLDAAQDYERSSLLSERQKLALRLSDAYIRQPAVPPAALREALLDELSAFGVIELLLRQFRYTWNKTLVALGLDGEQVARA